MYVPLSRNDAKMRASNCVPSRSAKIIYMYGSDSIVPSGVRLVASFGHLVSHFDFAFRHSNKIKAV